MKTVRRGGLAWSVVSLLACGPAPISQPRPGPSAAVSSCNEQVSRTLAESEAAAREGYLDRSGRILDAGLEACPDARLAEALAKAWLEQGRNAAVARLLQIGGGASLAPAIRTSLTSQLVEAQKHPRDPDEILAEARDAVAREDDATARRRYDQALASLVATLDEDEAPTLLFLDPATAHRLDDDDARRAIEADDGALHLWPARDLEGRLGTAVALSAAPDRAFRWFAGGAQVVAKGLVFAAGALRPLGPERAGQSRAIPATGWSRWPAGDVLLLDTEDGVEQLTLPALQRVAEVPIVGLKRSYRWLDEHRVVVRSSGQREVAMILDTRRPGQVTAKVSGLLVAVADSGSHLAQVASDGKTDLLSVVDGGTGRELFRHEVSVTGDAPALTISHDGKDVVFVAGDGTAVVFAVPSGRRRMVGTKMEPPWHSVSSAAMSDDGWVCVDARYANWSRCELQAAVNIHGAPRLPSGQTHACFREARGASVVPLPTQAQSPGRERIRSARGPAVDLCARVKGPRFVVWLEARVTGEGPDRSTTDLVLVVWDPRARRVHRTIPLERVAYDASNAYGELAIDGDLVHGQLGSFRFIADMAKGTARIEPNLPREATTGFPRALVEVSDAGFARSDGGSVIDLQTGSAATAPPGATWKTSLVTFEGVRVGVDDGHLQLADRRGERLAQVTTFAKGFSVATFPDQQLELLGTKRPALGCLFGDRVTELEVCEERYLTSGRYRRLFATK